MEDSSTSGTSTSSNTAPRIRLGMGSFGNQERNDFGQKIRLAMACIEGKAKPVNSKAMPSDAVAINQRLVALSQDITSHHADLLELLVRFDDLEGWKTTGAKHCTAWMNLELGINMKLGYEYLRVGRELRSLHTTTALFRAGKLSWSKVRLISRVADQANEKLLCHAALDASVTDVERFCTEYRWEEENSDNADNDSDRYMRQWESRSLSHSKISNGSTLIRLILPPDLAQAYLNSIEHSLNGLTENQIQVNPLAEPNSTLSQRRADAAVLMAETSLQSAGRDIATADRYQVIVSVAAGELAKDAEQTGATAREPKQKSHQKCQSTNRDDESETNDVSADHQSDQSDENGFHVPSKRPTVKGAGPIAAETARRIACDCTLSTNMTSNGEPIDIGRRSRVWPVAMSRAIKERDQHCQWPGCSQTHNLHIHHIKHWADGGTTCIENGVSLCSAHHTAVHEGGFIIQRVNGNEQRMKEQFIGQLHRNDIAQFDFERHIRSNHNSFDRVRQLSPTRFRFRINDKRGRDVREAGIRLSDVALGKCTDSTVQDSTSTLLDSFAASDIRAGMAHTNSTHHAHHSDCTDHSQHSTSLSTRVDSGHSTAGAPIAKADSQATTQSDLLNVARPCSQESVETAPAGSTLTKSTHVENPGPANTGSTLENIAQHEETSRPTENFLTGYKWPHPSHRSGRTKCSEPCPSYTFRNPALYYINKSKSSRVFNGFPDAQSTYV